MAKPLSKDQRRVWAEKIKSQQESGLSIQRWCKRNDTASFLKKIGSLDVYGCSKYTSRLKK